MAASMRRGGGGVEPGAGVDHLLVAQVLAEVAGDRRAGAAHALHDFVDRGAAAEVVEGGEGGQRWGRRCATPLPSPPRRGGRSRRLRDGGDVDGDAVRRCSSRRSRRRTARPYSSRLRFADAADVEERRRACSGGGGPCRGARRRRTRRRAARRARRPARCAGRAAARTGRGRRLPRSRPRVSPPRAALAALALGGLAAVAARPRRLSSAAAAVGEREHVVLAGLGEKALADELVDPVADRRVRMIAEQAVAC